MSSDSLPAFDSMPTAPASGTQLAAGGGASAMPAGALAADWPTLAALSRRYIDRALARTSGNKTRAAAVLGIDRRTLNRILARERARAASGT